MSNSQQGAVAAGHRLTATAAAEVLADGGNAFDAATAGLWMACVCEPVLSSPGGGGFLVAREGASGRTTLYDFFVQTPRRKADPAAIDFSAVHADFGTATQEFHIGHGATATPGFVPGLFAVHGDLGALAMNRLIDPAVAAARDGVKVTAFQAFLSQVVQPILTANADCNALFAPEGRMVEAGGRFANPALAGFLERLADGGMDWYLHEAAPALCAAQEGSGHLACEDFEAYRVERRVPLEVAAGDGTAALNPPPSAGGAFVACALQALAGGETASVPALAQALARADALRIAHGGDALAMLADIGMAPAPAPEPVGGAATRGTTHVSVIDRAGNAAAATVSNGSGNGRVLPAFGFMLNNMLGEADLNLGGFHRWRENARPASNMCPAVAWRADGSLSALGSGGSNRIRSAVFQVLARLMLGGLTPEAAVHAPRVHVEDGHLDFEDDLEPRARAALVSAFPDHRAWPERNLFYGGVHTVLRAPDGTFQAAGDARRAGTALVV